MDLTGTHSMLGYGLALLGIVVFAFYRLFVYPGQRRRRVSGRPFPLHWQQQLTDQMALYRRLPQQQRDKLHGDIQLILDQVAFYGCAGLTLTEPMKVLIAAHGALLVNGLTLDYYQKLQSILVYPGAYRVTELEQDGEVLSHSEQERLGESWHVGRLVLAWQTLAAEAADPDSRSNVGLHEFSHQLDQVDGSSDGAPPLASGEVAQHWQQVFTEAWERRRSHCGGDSIIDEYGATSPAEFFAVASEAFFLHPTLLNEEEPKLYQCLAGFYRLDPKAW